MLEKMKVLYYSQAQMNVFYLWYEIEKNSSFDQLCLLTIYPTLHPTSNPEVLNKVVLTSVV